uniref:SH2 domain-containing protein n=1 Tax=Xiphophorus maculatus TaxID=8083 RepID=A0A3B5PWG9_XIPMA
MTIVLCQTRCMILIFTVLKQSHCCLTRKRFSAILPLTHPSLTDVLFSLCSKQKVVYTYRILQAHNGNYTLLTAGGLQETYFKTLADLIRNYKRKNQGLAIHLRHSVKKKTPMLIQPPRRPETQPEAPATPPARRSAGGPAAASARGSAAASARGWGGASGGHSLQRGAAPLPEEENDYESM